MTVDWLEKYNILDLKRDLELQRWMATGTSIQYLKCVHFCVERQSKKATVLLLLFLYCRLCWQ